MKGKRDTDTPRAVSHSSFVIERDYAAAPARVFGAWADAAAKQRWFVCAEDWVVSLHELDFRVGGRELLHVGPRGGELHRFEAQYFDIVPERRIVYAYSMHLDARRISVSLATLELTPGGSGTRFVFTEQAAFLDGYDGAQEREHGTRVGLEHLAQFLSAESAAGSALPGERGP